MLPMSGGFINIPQNGQGLIYSSYVSNASELHGDKLHVDVRQTESLVQALVQAVLDHINTQQQAASLKA